MNNMELKLFPSMGSEDNWRTQSFRQSVVSKIEEVIQRSGMQVARNSSEMENHVFMKAKTREEYMNMVAKLILHVREMSTQKPNQAPNMQGPNQNQAGPNPQVQNQQGQNQQGPNQPGLAPDPINALQNLASQGTRNQMMNIGPQGQMQQQGVMGPNQGMGMQGQMGQQGPINSQGPQAQTATNLLQTLNQRPQLNMNLQGKLGKPRRKRPFQKLAEARLELIELHKKMINKELEEKMLKKLSLKREMEQKKQLFGLEKQERLLKIKLLNRELASKK